MPVTNPHTSVKHYNGVSLPTATSPIGFDSCCATRPRVMVCRAAYFTAAGVVTHSHCRVSAFQQISIHENGLVVLRADESHVPRTQEAAGV